jgi:hypothetical protein
MSVLKGSGSKRGQVTMFRYTLLLFATVAAAPVFGDSWAQSMFEEHAKDFGSVPRGPMLAYSFRITNKGQQPVHIAGVRVSCGCVSAAATQDQLAPGESAAIQATMDTRRFTGPKSVTIYVQFDQPQWDEARLSVQANGRDDISITPDTLSFGKVKKGSAPSASANLHILGGSWNIMDVQTESNYIRASVKEVRRDTGEAGYELTASIRPDAPVGKWYSDIWLKTNNDSMPRIRVPLTVEVEPLLTLSSTSVQLGDVKTGTQAERKIVVRGAQPFKVTRIEGSDAAWSVEDNTKDSKPVHVLTIKLKNPRAGEQSKKFKVVTDLKEDGEVEFVAKAQVRDQ